MVGSSSTNIHIDGVTTPAIGPTAPRWWHGLERDRRAGLEERDRVLGVVDQALERGAAHQRAAQRAGGAVPVDRRAGVQELAGLEAEQLGRGRDVDERRLDAEHRGQRLRVGVAAPRVGGHGGQVGLGAGHRRAPVDAGDVDGLGGHGVGEQVGADADDVVGAVVIGCLRAARRRGGWPRRWTGGPRRRPRPAARTCRSRSCGSAAVPTTRRPPAGGAAGDRRGEQRRPGRARRRGRAPRRAAPRRCAGRRRPGPACSSRSVGSIIGCARPAV